MKQVADARTDHLGDWETVGIARADQRNPISSARRARIKQAAQLARRRIKSLSRARKAITQLEVEIGRALARIVDQGASHNEAFELAGLSRHHGRRYLQLAQEAHPSDAAGASPATGTGDAIHPVVAAREPDGIKTDATPPGRHI